jgi:hypothetical protein
MEEIGWTDRVGNKVLRRVKWKGGMVQTLKSWKDNRIGNILPSNCLRKQAVERNIEGKRAVKGGR